MRKGSIHIDWAISMGIFLISLIALFVFLRPGVKEESSGDVLLDLIQGNLEKNISTKAEKIPLIVEKLDWVVPPSGSKPEINIHPISSGWSITKFENVKTPPFESPDISGNDFILKCNVGDPNNEGMCGTKNNLGDHQPIELIFFKSAADSNELEINGDICGHASINECDASLGVTETIDGISRDWMESLFTNSEYERIKAEWGVPLNRDFAIYHDTQKLFGIEPPENGNVFARQVKYWALNSDGTRDKYEVMFKSW